MFNTTFRPNESTHSSIHRYRVPVSLVLLIYIYTYIHTPVTCVNFIGFQNWQNFRDVVAMFAWTGHGAHDVLLWFHSVTAILLTSDGFSLSISGLCLQPLQVPILASKAGIGTHPSLIVSYIPFSNRGPTVLVISRLTFSEFTTSVFSWHNCLTSEHDNPPVGQRECCPSPQKIHPASCRSPKHAGGNNRDH